MNKRLGIIITAVAMLSAISVAGIRSPGKYSGVVIFDRWGGCTLYGGVSVMYVSEAVKEPLRAEAGKCVQIDAVQVEQPVNPGDGLIKRFTYLGPAPADERGASAEGLKISAIPDFKDGGVPQFVIRVENVSDQPRTVRMGTLAVTILAAQTKPPSGLSPSDGPSVAVVTRQSFWSDGPRMQAEGIDQSVSYRWWVTAPRALGELVALPPKAAFELHVSFKMPAGEYEFLAGYGGMNAGRCIASNLIAFDAKADGTATLPKVPGR
ncbi:MAG TPA: hypothetical protein VGO11_00780 [Chthoniobacteraceae bacterium]|jgi:hypothetical protein|nr:hypothetical protein [Chthoniobacteraceae bacterium]